MLLGNGDGTFSAPVYYYDGADTGIVLTTADLNGDGKLDITAITSIYSTAILFGNGDGTFQNAVFPTSLNGFAAVYTADVNNDGKPDLLSSNQVALGNGDGTFTVLPPLPNFIAALGDLNGDGKLDLLEAFDNSTGNANRNGGAARKWRRYFRCLLSFLSDMARCRTELFSWT